MADGIHADPVKTEFLDTQPKSRRMRTRSRNGSGSSEGEPDLDPADLLSKSHTEYQEGTSLLEMIREDLVAERIAIESYKEMIAFVGEDDPTTRRLFEWILGQEEEHADIWRISSSPSTGAEGPQKLLIRQLPFGAGEPFRRPRVPRRARLRWPACGSGRSCASARTSACPVSSRASRAPLLRCLLSVAPGSLPAGHRSSSFQGRG